MKTYSQKLFVLFVTCVVTAWLGASAHAQVTLTVNPSVVSNTYAGVITLDITGLTNGEKVTVQKFIDLNGNGSVDAGEPMFDAFKIADGGAMVISGITNLNVPFDSNPTNGEITTSLHFLPQVVLDNIVGQQIIRVVSPTGRFSPVTATLTVTNFPFAQWVSGTIYSNGVPLPNGMLVLQDQQQDNPVAATVADANGHYFLPLPPGNYTPIPGWQNSFYDFNTAPSITLTNGGTATNDLFLTNGTVSIAGNVYDSSSSNAIGGLLLFLQSGSLAEITFTDTNGNYSADATSSFWKVQPVKERLARRAYVVPTSPFQVDTTTGAVANANIALPKGTALFYGRVLNNSNVPLANVEMDGGTSGSVNNSYSAKGYSDTNGYYTVAILGDQTNQWNCEINNGRNTSIASYIFNTFSTLALTNNQTVAQDFFGLPVTATISGHVQDNSGADVTGVTLMASATINSLNYMTLDGTTDNSGNYTLSAASGQWQVQFLTGGFSDNLDAHGYVDLTGPHIVTIPPTNTVLNLTVYPIGTPYLSGAYWYSASQFAFTVQGASNVTYSVEVSTNLASTNWTGIATFMMLSNSAFMLDSTATNASRFYRVKKF